jgi:hypothetical protein
MKQKKWCLLRDIKALQRIQNIESNLIYMSLSDLVIN